MKTYALKFIILILLLSAYASQSFAQHRKTVMHLPKYDLEPYHFGFILAANQMLLTWKPVNGYQLDTWTEGVDVTDITYGNAKYFGVKQIESDLTYGFNVGIVGNLRLANHFDLRFIPTLTFGDRVLHYDMIAYDKDHIPLGEFRKTKVIPSTMVEFPLHLKYRSKRFNNFATYLLVGIKPTIEMVSRKAKENKDPDFGSAGKVNYIDVNKGDFFYDVGVGTDFYTPYFKFGVEAKMSFGSTNIKSNNANFNDHLYSKSLQSLNNKVFQLSFTFE